MFHTLAFVWLTLRLSAVLCSLAWLGVRLGWFMFLPPEAKRNAPAAMWARFRWRWLTRNLSLSYVDEHRKSLKLAPFGTSVTYSRANGRQYARLRFPRAVILPDAYGLVARVRTVPGVGREEFEDARPHLANAWKCHRVSVSQPAPGRLLVRGLRRDPLTLPYPAADMPPDVLAPSEQVNGKLTGPLRLYLGRDEWAEHRSFHLPGTTGITVGGLPGYGKTSLVNLWLAQLAGYPVRLVIIDGKGGGDYEDWAPYASTYVGDSLADAAAALEDTHALMRDRLATVQEVTGSKNAWHTGPTRDFPLVVVVIDECHTFFDLNGVKGSTAAAKEAEKHVRTCQSMAGQLIKKGRSALFVTVLLTQKQTSDAVPTALRDNCGLGLSFAVKTKDAAVAALGEQIREYPSYCPSGLQAMPDYVGVCTASLRKPGMSDPFVRLRVPHVPESLALERARLYLPPLELVPAKSPAAA